MIRKVFRILDKSFPISQAYLVVDLNVVPAENAAALLLQKRVLHRGVGLDLEERRDLETLTRFQ